MKHILLLYWIISFSIGFTTLLGMMLIYFRNQNIILRNYIFIMIPFSILVIITGLKNYKDINLPFATQKTDLLLDIIFIIAVTSIIFLSPFFSHSFVRKSFQFKVNIIFAISSICWLTILLFTYILFYPFYQIINIVFIIFVLISSVYSIGFVVINLEKIEKREIRSYLFSLFIMGLFIMIIFIFDLIINFKEKTSLASGGFRVGVLLYLIWNLITIIYSVKYFFHEKLNSDSDLNFNVFCKKFNISEREKEVIRLVIQGKSNKDIADKLYISTGTVKRHVHNIYEKTKAKTRMEILNIIKNSN